MLDTIHLLQEGDVHRHVTNVTHVTKAPTEESVRLYEELKAKSLLFYPGRILFNE